MKTLLGLGLFHLHKINTNSVDDASSSKFSLDLVLDESLDLVRLSNFLPSNLLYGEYWYSSGTNELMVESLKDLVEEILIKFKFSEKQTNIWIDIASNDGTLLSKVPTNFKKIGIDPIQGDQLNQSHLEADIINDYFSAETYFNSEFKELRANVITCVAMFYDVPNPVKFLNDIKLVLSDDGLLVLQLSYTPLMISQLAFDNICHEHLYYYDLTSIKKLADFTGFSIIDVSLNSTNGGSFRIYLKKKNPLTWNQINVFQKSVNLARINSLISYETHNINIRSIETWKSFHTEILVVKRKIILFIDQILNNDNRIMAYGASTKGTTLLQFFGLDNSKIEAIVERDNRKVGLVLVGSKIPIISENEMRQINPDYLLVLPWHFIDSFLVRERNYIENGGSFLVPLPIPILIDRSGVKII